MMQFNKNRIGLVIIIINVKNTLLVNTHVTVHAMHTKICVSFQCDHARLILQHR